MLVVHRLLRRADRRMAMLLRIIVILGTTTVLAWAAIQGRQDTQRRPRAIELIDQLEHFEDETNPDTWEGEGGYVGRSTEDRVYVFDPLFPELPARKIFLHPVAAGKKVLLSAKFRYGAFYRRFKDQVQRHDPVSGAWVTVLEAPVSFAQFDITEDGRIVLISTYEPFYRVRHPLRIAHEFTRPGSSNLVEVFEPMGTQATRQVPYPEEVLKVYAQVDGILPVDRVWNIRDTLVLFQQSTGLLYRFDAQAGRMTLVDVPWHTLLNTYFPEGKAKFPLPKPGGKGFIDCAAFPIYPALYPAGNRRLALVLGVAVRLKGKPVHHHLGKAEDQLLPFPEELIHEGITPLAKRTIALVWDLDEGGLKPIELSPDIGMAWGQSRMWVDYTGNWKRFADMVPNLDPPKVPVKPEAVTKPAKPGLKPAHKEAAPAPR